MIHLVAITGPEGQIGIGGAVPWVGNDACMELAAEFSSKVFAEATDGIWVCGCNTAPTLQSLIRQTGIRARLAIYSDPHQPIELVEGLQKHWPGRDIWVMGGAKTFQDFMPLVDRHHILVVPYDGPADCYLAPILPAWQIEGENIKRTAYRA